MFEEYLAMQNADRETREFNARRMDLAGVTHWKLASWPGTIENIYEHRRLGSTLSAMLVWKVVYRRVLIGVSNEIDLSTHL